MFQISLFVMSVLYIVAGLLHFIKPKMYLKIMPPFLPAHLFLVYLSGLAEIVLGIGLLIPTLQIYAAWGVILLLIAVFPANVYMYQQGPAVMKMSNRVLFWRMPFQLVLMAWAYCYT